MQDARSRFLHNEGARRANEVRQRRATVENPQWAMSRPAEWYQNRENLRSVKDTLANVKGNRDFLTTDQDESRNMYQMIMNNMRGGKGARMLDTRGLPKGARRYGRTLFTDPAKSQGFFGDVGSLFTGKNQAAVRAPEWNPLHEEGYGRDWYKEQFPKTSGFMDFMDAAPKFLPGIGMASRIFGGKEREPLPSDRSWIPKGVGSYKQVPMIDLEAMDRDINEGIGIASVVDSDPEERAEYAERTFGADRHPGTASIIEGPMEQSEVIYSPHAPTYYDRAEGLDFYEDPNQPYVAPDDYVEDDFGAFADTFMPIERDSNREDFIRRQNEVIPAESLPLGSPNPQGDFPITYPQDKPINWDLENNKYYQDLTPEEIDYIFGRTDEIADEEMNIPPPIVPFDDTGRETGIASLYGQGPQYATNNRRYENEYRDFIANMSDTLRQFGPLTYEEFADMYEKMYQGKPHTGFTYQSPASMR